MSYPHNKMSMNRPVTGSRAMPTTAMPINGANGQQHYANALLQQQQMQQQMATYQQQQQSHHSHHHHRPPSPSASSADLLQHSFVNKMQQLAPPSSNASSSPQRSRGMSTGGMNGTSRAELHPVNMNGHSLGVIGNSRADFSRTQPLGSSSTSNGSSGHAHFGANSLTASSAASASAAAAQSLAMQQQIMGTTASWQQYRGNLPSRGGGGAGRDGMTVASGALGGSPSRPQSSVGSSRSGAGAMLASSPAMSATYPSHQSSYNIISHTTPSAHSHPSHPSHQSHPSQQLPTSWSRDPSELPPPAALGAISRRQMSDSSSSSSGSGSGHAPSPVRAFALTALDDQQPSSRFSRTAAIPSSIVANGAASQRSDRIDRGGERSERGERSHSVDRGGKILLGRQQLQQNQQLFQPSPKSPSQSHYNQNQQRQTFAVGQQAQSQQTQNQHQHTPPAGFDRPPASSSPFSYQSPPSLGGSLGMTQRLGSTQFGSALGATQLGSALPPPHSPYDTSSSGGAVEPEAFLEVGVAEDPNPRFRPTMEDAHIIRMGESWESDEASSSKLRSGPGGPGALGLGASKRFGMDTTSKAHSPAKRATTTHSPGGVQANSQHGYFAIYDGHGGREAVDYIEQHLHKSLASHLSGGRPPAAALEAAFLDTDKQMQNTRRYQESGSTVASALLRPSTSRVGQRDLFVANVGDARAVVAVGGNTATTAPMQAIRLSRDHTPNDPAEAARVRAAGGAVFRGRVDGQLAVSRAMGDHALQRSGVSAVPHQHHLPLTKQHKFMIVACDGLWDVMTDGEAVNLISGMKDANKMADKLVRTAMERGTTDNVSAMVVRLQK